MSLWQRLFGRSVAEVKVESPSESVEADSEDFDQSIEEMQAEENNQIDSEIETASNEEDATKQEVDAVASESQEDHPIVNHQTIDQEIVETSEPLDEIKESDEVSQKISENEPNEPSVEPESPEDDVEPEPADIAHDVNEDLSVIDGQLLPELVVPDWQEELKLVKERYETCDISDHIVKVSKRRLTAKRIDLELANNRLGAYKRYLDRASRRFKEKIDEDKLLNEIQIDLQQWKSQQSKSVAWRLAERINEEVLKAKQAELEATSFVEKNNIFSNPNAVDRYRHFSRRVFLIPIVTLYLTSVVSLTYNRFDWILKFLPFFNLGLRSALVMISGVASGFWLANLWRYSKSVSNTQKELLAFNTKYQDQYNKIRHAVKEHTRLAQQQPHVEPILRVLAKAYRVQLQSDVGIKAQATTYFDPSSLPACVTLARAIDNDEMKMAKLRRQALRVLMSPGWRTNGLEEIARIHADSKMLDPNSLSLKSLDTDSVVSAANAQKILLEAFSNTSIHNRVSKARLIRAIRDLHFEVLAKWDSTDRPDVVSLRDDGFNKISFRSSWLEDEDVAENWIDFLTEILDEETAPFGTFNIHDKRSELNDETKITSVAVVPHYFEIKPSRVSVTKSPVKEVMPMDVVVRVDVSPWDDPSAFAVFADDHGGGAPSAEIEDAFVGGGTSA